MRHPIGADNMSPAHEGGPHALCLEGEGESGGLFKEDDKKNF